MIFFCGFKEFFCGKLAFWPLQIVEGRGKLVLNLWLVKPEGFKKKKKRFMVDSGKAIEFPFVS